MRKPVTLRPFLRENPHVRLGVFPDIGPARGLFCWKSESRTREFVMGLFEQLENEAELKRREAAHVEALRRGRSLRDSGDLWPRMRELDGYLHQLVERLLDRKPVARLSWALPGYGEVVAYLDHQYDLRAVVDGDSYQLGLSCSAEVASRECPLVVAEGIAAVTEVAAALWKQRLFGVLHANRNGAGEAVSARFQARGRVLFGLQLSAAAGEGCARLQSWNIGSFGQRRRDIDPAHLQPLLFEPFERFLDSPAPLAVASATAACGRQVLPDPS
jgi:hypothetical protein